MSMNNKIFFLISVPFFLFFFCIALKQINVIRAQINEFDKQILSVKKQLHEPEPKDSCIPRVTETDRNKFLTESVAKIRRMNVEIISYCTKTLSGDSGFCAEVILRVPESEVSSIIKLLESESDLSSCFLINYISLKSSRDFLDIVLRLVPSENIRVRNSDCIKNPTKGFVNLFKKEQNIPAAVVSSEEKLPVKKIEREVKNESYSANYKLISILSGMEGNVCVYIKNQQGNILKISPQNVLNVSKDKIVLLMNEQKITVPNFN